MPINIGANTVGGIFSNNCFRVPPYQRAYAWTEEPHLRDFMNDLLSHFTVSKRSYYLGTLLLTQSDNQQNSLLTQYDIVDGQQRLTTITIFVTTAIGKMALDDEYLDDVQQFTNLLLRSIRNQRLFQTIAEDDAFFERFIIGGEIAEDKDCKTPSQRRLYLAKRYFQRQVESIDTILLIKILETLYKSTILVYAVESPIEATQIFEFQNDRGKRLTNLEALKSYLMHGLYLHGGETTENDLRYVQAQFARLYRTAEIIEGEILAPDEDQLLGYHCAAYLPQVTLLGDEGWRKPKELVRHILQTPELLGEGGPAEFIRNFAAKLADSYDDALSILQSRVGAVPVASLFVLQRTAIFWPLLIKCWRLGQTANEKNFLRVTTAMERFASASALANVRADTGESYLRRIAYEFTGNFEELIFKLVKLRTGWSIPTRLANGIDDPGFYHTGRTARYVLWKYENHLRSQRGNREQLLSWNALIQNAPTAEQYGLDHILPQETETVILEAPTRWDVTNLEEIERPFRDIFLHRLGNLVLDTRSTGASKGNKAFKDRIEHYSRSTFASQKEIVSKFASKSDNDELIWNVESIRKRHLSLKKFILENI